MKTRALLLLFCLFATTGCAGSVERWITTTRVHQGDSALESGNADDALAAYRLALNVDPKNEHAKSGLVEASSLVAQEYYVKGEFEDATKVIADGLAVDPTSIRLTALRGTIEQAKVKRNIVLSNYPAYADAQLQLIASYKSLDASNKQIVRTLSNFRYTFNSDDLTKAIKESYELQLVVAKNTNKLIAYRQLVESGSPEAAQAAASAPSASSLLPLP